METDWVSLELVFQKCGCLANMFGAHAFSCRTYQTIQDGLGRAHWRLRPICQVHNFRTSEITCPAREMGGSQCEVPGEHEQHRIGEHTIRHRLAGNGHPCDAVERWIDEDARS